MINFTHLFLVFLISIFDIKRYDGPDSHHRKPCFLKLIPVVFGRFENFNITQIILVRGLVFADYLSDSCD